MSSLPYSSSKYDVLPHWLRPLIIAGGLLVLTIIIFKLLASLVTTYWWFSSINFGQVFHTNLMTQIGLIVAFSLIFALACYGSLFFAVSRAHLTNIFDLNRSELVFRFRAFIVPRTHLILGFFSLGFGLLVGASAGSQWQNWLLFTHPIAFHVGDGQFGIDASYFVFKLPFISFLVAWSFSIVLIILFLTILAYYLSGAIDLKGSPRFAPIVKAHVSFLIALIALIKFFGYFFVLRPGLDLSTTGFVEGASYTNVHVQIPAYELLSAISLFCMFLLIINVIIRTWKLLLVALATWTVVSLVAGIIYPAIVQRFRVQPSQSQLELPFIQRNISATTYAYGLRTVHNITLNETTSSNPSTNVASLDQQSLRDAKVWNAEYAQPSFNKLQATRNFYQIPRIEYDRYNIFGQEILVLIGVRELNPTSLPSSSWVSQHLQYTHGYGVVVAPANQSTQLSNPNFVIQNVPIQSAPGWPIITQPDIYFGLNETGYVIVDTKQEEFDYLNQEGQVATSQYKSNQGVKLNGLIPKLMYAIEFGDVNILTSSLIGGNSQILYYRNILSRISKVAPFLSLDSDPYPVIANGKIYWIVDAYTTSSTFPYSQAIGPTTGAPLSPLSRIQAGTNYIRNSVKIVINAYSGNMTFYSFDPKDPVLRAWEAIYPSLFTPLTKMPQAIRSHLRYPEDLFALQSQLYGRYHLKQSASFYIGSNAWTVAQAPSSSPSSSFNALNTDVPVNPSGLFSPVYEEVALPGQSNPQFYLEEPMVPVSGQNQSNSQQVLSSLFVASCDQSNYGVLYSFVIPPNTEIAGPAIATALLDSQPSISTDLTFLNQQGSSVTLGIVSIIPFQNSFLYLRPLYVSSSSNPIPTLRYVIAIYGHNAIIEPTLDQLISDLLGTQSSQTIAPGNSSPDNTSSIMQLLNQAQSLYNDAQLQLKNGNLGQYQSDINQMDSLLQQAQKLLSSPQPTPTSTIPPTTQTTTTLANST